MATYVYNTPVVYTPESNETFINKRLVGIRICPPEVREDIAGTWNYNLCPQDDEYCQPFISGDKIYQQYLIPTDAIKNVYPSLVNANDDTEFWIPNAGITSQTGEDEDGNRYENLIIDTSYIPANICCFYIQWNLYYADIDYGTWSACVTDRITNFGYTDIQAYNYCTRTLIENPNVNWKTKVSEPYCRETCGRPTLLIKGFYPKYDCNGSYYAAFFGGGTNSFIPQLRVYGEIDNDGFNFTETLQKKARKSSKQIASYTLRTPKIPPYVAKQMAVCFNSKTLTIDGVEYTKAAQLEKNNEDGNMWIINTQLTIECDEISFTCN